MIAILELRPNHFLLSEEVRTQRIEDLRKLGDARQGISIRTLERSNSRRRRDDEILAYGILAEGLKEGKIIGRVVGRNYIALQA